MSKFKSLWVAISLQLSVSFSDFQFVRVSKPEETEIVMF